MSDSGMKGQGILAEWDPANDPRWDEFASAHPEGMAYHQSAWTQVVAETYGHRPFFLGLSSPDGGRLEGILPFVLLNSHFSKQRLVSLPYTAYCPPLMPEDRMDEAFRFAFARLPGIRFIETKFLAARGGGGERTPGFRQSPFVTQILSLSGTLEELFLSFHATSVRQRVRRAEREGLTFRLTDEESGLRCFYRLFAEVRREHGLPLQPYRFFANMRRLLTPRGLFELGVIEFRGAIIAAAVVLKHRSTWHLEYSVSDSRFLKYCPNQLLVWECIKRAHGNQAKTFDFGRTALWHRSLLEFKDRWNTERRPICHRFFPADTELPDWRDNSGNFLLRLNRKLPLKILEWEGRLIFPHRG
jgi:hypothetical protein